MELALTEEQQQLAATLRSLLDKRADSAAVRTAMSGEPGYDESLWQTLCDQIGVAGLVVPEEYDGVGATLFETAVALEEVGRSLAPSPLLATTIATAALLLHGSDHAKASLLPRIAAGEVATLVWDAPAGPGLVLDGAAASIVLALDGGGLQLVGNPTATPRPALDPTMRLAEVDGDGEVIGSAEDDRPLRDLSTALVTSLQLGCARRALGMTVAYSLERVQFGRPIGSFQALKHRMADLLVLLEMMRSASWAASRAASAYLLEPGADRAATLHERATVAKAYCSDALDRIAGETIQLHGGIAITWEHDAHLVFKRAHALSQLFGRAHEHRAALDL